jgi:hypothetical protein
LALTDAEGVGAVPGCCAAHPAAISAAATTPNDLIGALRKVMPDLTVDTGAALPPVGIVTTDTATNRHKNPITVPAWRPVVIELSWPREQTTGIGGVQR